MPIPISTCIGASNHQAAEIITGHVIEMGHRDICFMFPDTQFNDRARDRRSGALQTAANAGIVVPGHRFYECPYDLGEAKKLARSILSNNRPSAVVCGNDIIAHGVIYAAQSIGLRVPDDVSVAGIGDFRGSGDMEPGLTTVRMPARRIGSMAADTIVTMSVNGKPAKPKHHKIEISLIKRESVRALHNAAN